MIVLPSSVTVTNLKLPEKSVYLNLGSIEYFCYCSIVAVDSSVTTVERNSDFLVKKSCFMVSDVILGCRLPAGFRCRSGNSPNYLQLVGSYQVKKSE